MIKKKILIATGGTGGHVFPAYSLATYLINKNFKVKITSDKRGLRYLKNYQNLDLIEISSSPIVKKNLIKLFISLFIIIFSIIKSLIFLTFNRPSLIFGMGGYSSFPICAAASILRIKFIIYENYMIIGKANKFLLPFADKVFVSYKELEGISVDYKNKVLEIGNLIREEIFSKKTPKDQFYEANELKILVLGGSQAAKIFADILPKIFEKLNDSKIIIKVYQQCLEEQNDKLSIFYKNAKIDFEIFNFTDQIVNYYTKANLVITRAGASVLGELINFNIPFISIPLPSSADNHQLKNAEFYHRKGYGFLLEEKDVEHKLYDLIKSIFNDKFKINKILTNQKQISDKDIFKNLNIQLEKIINEKN